MAQLSEEGDSKTQQVLEQRRLEIEEVRRVSEERLARAQQLER